MREALVAAAIGSATALPVAAGGWVLAWRMHTQEKLLHRQAQRISRLEREVRARIALEIATCAWLGELCDKSPLAIQRDLRRRTRERAGLCPRMTPRDVVPAQAQAA